MQEITKALIAFRDACPVVPFDKENPHFHSRFASLTMILKVIKSHLSDNGLSVIQFPHSEIADGRVCVGCRTIITHESGESIESEFVFPAAKQDPQAGMSALTYARRGALGAALGLVIEEGEEDAASAGYEDLSNVGNRQKSSSKPAPPAKLTAAHVTELKAAAMARLDELGDEKGTLEEILDAVAIKLKYKSRKDLFDCDFENALAAISEVQGIPF